MTTWNIKDHVVEYDDDTHEYIVDGMIVPSVTQLIHMKFPNKYKGVSQEVLDHAAELGTMMHLTIEMIEKYGDVPHIPEEVSREITNYRGLKKVHGWEVVAMETPVLIPYEGEVIAAGRFDILANMNAVQGLIDLKRTATVDREYLAYQLTLYAMGYRYSYGTHVNFLKCLHLREDTRKLIDIPFIYKEAVELLKEAKERGI